MVDVALQVDERRALFKNIVLKALFDGVDDLVHVGVALADVHIVTDADDVGHEGDHVRRFADRLSVRHLRFALVEILHLKTEEVRGRGEGEAGARRVVAE